MLIGPTRSPSKNCKNLSQDFFIVNMEKCQVWCIKSKVTGTANPLKNIRPCCYQTCICLDISGERLAKKVVLLAIEIMKETMPPSDIFMKLCRERDFGRGGLKQIQHVKDPVQEGSTTIHHPTCTVEFANKLLELFFACSAPQKKSSNHSSSVSLVREVPSCSGQYLVLLPKTQASVLVLQYNLMPADLKAQIYE